MSEGFKKIGEFDSSDPADPFGDQATLRKLADVGSYLLRVRIERLPTRDNVLRMRRIMTVTAERFAGEYDGWEAAVRRPKPAGPARR